MSFNFHSSAVQKSSSSSKIATSPQRKVGKANLNKKSSNIQKQAAKRDYDKRMAEKAKYLRSTHLANAETLEARRVQQMMELLENEASLTKKTMVTSANYKEWAANLKALGAGIGKAIGGIAKAFTGGSKGTKTA